MPDIAEIRAIQAGLSARGMVWTAQGAAITADNGEPSGSSAGVDVRTSSGKSAVISSLWVKKGASVTSYGVRVWGYATEPDGATKSWAVLGELAFAGQTVSKKEMFPSGSEERIYLEIFDLVDSGSDGVLCYVGHADPS